VRAHPTPLSGLCLLEPAVFSDDRGSFFESWNAGVFAHLTGANVQFVQDNHSTSALGVLRGMHYQVVPRAQGKLVRCVRGRIFDAVIDIRRSSPTFGQWFGVELSAANRMQLWVPVGFAHGFLALEDGCEVLYKTTDTWSKEHERCIRWNDPAVSIAWPALAGAASSAGLSAAAAAAQPRLIPRDAEAPYLADAEVYP
jgi:dTDP-4-dehydrorhamnose 3,5-epimerase